MWTEVAGAFLALAAPAHAERIKDLGTFQGVRPNQLTGYAAAVIVTAELPPFAKPGQRLDITVGALGKAKSLRGGTLIMMPLLGADGQTYAMAQGNLAVGGLGIDAADGSKLTVNVPSSGRIPGGATVERAVDAGFAPTPGLTFHLAEEDLTTVRRVADAINAHAADQPDREPAGQSRRRARARDRQRAYRHSRDQRRGAHRSRRGQPREADRAGR